jgi:protein-disulfide isomerase
LQIHRPFTVAIAAAALTLTLLAGCAKGPGTPITTGDVVFGNEKSPVTVEEYASLSCPACAQFNNTYFADFKKKYIDTGQIKYVVREMTTHNAPLSTAAYLLARCAGHDKYLQVADAVYHADAQMQESGDFRGGLAKIARSVGLNEAQLDACTQDEKAIEAFNARVDQNMKVTTSTPTFVINGKLLDAAPTPENLDKAIADARAAPAAPASPPAKATP